jgi:hypothetical protein
MNEFRFLRGGRSGESGGIEIVQDKIGAPAASAGTRALAIQDNSKKGSKLTSADVSEKAKRQAKRAGAQGRGRENDKRRGEFF